MTAADVLTAAAVLGAIIVCWHTERATRRTLRTLERIQDTLACMKRQRLRTRLTEVVRTNPPKHGSYDSHEAPPRPREVN